MSQYVQICRHSSRHISNCFLLLFDIPDHIYFVLEYTAMSWYFYSLWYYIWWNNYVAHTHIHNQYCFISIRCNEVHITFLFCIRKRPIALLFTRSSVSNQFSDHFRHTIISLVLCLPLRFLPTFSKVLISPLICLSLYASWINQYSLHSAHFSFFHVFVIWMLVLLALQ